MKQDMIKWYLCLACMTMPTVMPQVLRAESLYTAQANVIHGTVTDTKGEPIIGASIVAASGSQGVITDIDGKFEINCKAGTMLKVSYIGYVAKTVKASGNIKVVLQEDNSALDEVVVVGYGAFKKSDLQHHLYIAASVTTWWHAK